jgi:hypothetical protein
MDYKTRIIKAPSYIERKTDDSALLWDIAFYSNQDVFEINVLGEQATQMISLPQQYLSFYRKLSMYFKNRKTTSDFKQLLGKHDYSLLIYPVGFSSGNALYRLSDIWIDEYTFVKALRSILGQKLWSHDHLKTLKKVNLHKESEDKLV